MGDGWQRRSAPGRGGGHSGDFTMRLMLRGYSRTRPVMKNGKHTGVNTSRQPPDGCRSLMMPSFAVCATGPMGLWLVFDED